MPRPVINVADVELGEMGKDAGFAAKVGSLGAATCSTGIGCMLHGLEPGKKAFPRLAHRQIHELLVIREGEGPYRFRDAEYAVRAGHVCVAPTGGSEVSQQITNTGTSTLKNLGQSTKAETEVVDYPDTGKVAVMSRFDWSTMSGGIGQIFLSGDAARDYFEGEH